MRPPRHISSILLGLAVLAMAPVTYVFGPPSGGVHNIHVTRGRMIVQDNVAVTRIRFFRHDLEAAIAGFHEMPSFELEDQLRADSLFMAYFCSRFSIEADEEVLAPAIASSGEDGEAWWYEIQYQREAPIGPITIRNELLFELFRDQKHLLRVVYFPSGVSQSLYFVAGASEYEISNEVFGGG